MRQFFTFFTLQLKRLVRRPAIIGSLLLVPLLTLALCLALPKNTAVAQIAVGVLLPEDSTTALRLRKALDTRSTGEFSFAKATSEAEVRQMVAAGAWECGYLFPNDLDTRVSEGRWQRMVTRVESPSSTLGVMLDWVVSSAVLDTCALDIAATYMDGIAPGLVRSSAAADVLNKASLLQVDVVPVNAPPASNATQTAAALLRGFIALILLLYSCLVAVMFAQDAALGFFERMRPYRGPVLLYLSGYGAAAALAAPAALAGLLLGCLFYPDAFTTPMRDIASLLLYLVLLAACCLLPALLCKRHQMLVCCIPFLMIACLLFCPIVADLSAFIPGGSIITWLLPPTLYLKAAAGNLPALLAMPAGAAILFLLCLPVLRLRAKP